MAEELPRVKLSAHPTQRADRVRVLIYVYRKDGMSREDFQTYWRDEHSHVFAQLPIVKKNLLKYAQMHFAEDAAAALKEQGTSIVEADGIAIMDAMSFDKIKEVFEDKEYHDQVLPDEAKFLARKQVAVFPCHIVDIFDEPS